MESIGPLGNLNCNWTWLEFLWLNKQKFVLRRNDICLWPEAVHDVGVVSVEVGRERTAQGSGQPRRPVWRVVDPRPGGEHRARHQDHPLEVRLPDHGAVDQVLHAGGPHPLQHLHLNTGSNAGYPNLLLFMGILILKACCRLFTILPSGNEHSNNLFYFVSQEKT